MSPLPWLRARRSATLLALAALVVPGYACDLPTRVPLLDTDWEAVVLTDTITTAELLPASMRVDDRGFVLDSFAVSSEVRLGDVCELCTCFDGPIPPIEMDPRDWRVELPAGLSEANLEGGTARLTLHNEVGFDVLDDGIGGKGWLDVAFVDTRTEEELDRVHVEGSLPPGDSLVVAFDLAGLVLSPYLVARVSGATPGTDCRTVEITPDLGFRADVALRDVVARSVHVLVSDAAVALPDYDLELPDAVADRLRPGDARVSVEVEASTRLPASLGLELSAASSPDALFTGEAALYTPLTLPAAAPGDPIRVRKEYLVDLAPLEGADRLYLATHNRVLGSRRVELRGSESIEFSVRLRARIPSR